MIQKILSKLFPYYDDPSVNVGWRVVFYQIGRLSE